MKVLWFSNTPSRYYSNGSGKGYNGGGWISSLEALVREDVELGIVFLTGSPEDAPRSVEGVKYYPVFDPTDNRKARTKKLFFGHNAADKYLVNKYLGVVREFKPDVIQVFGSEHSFGLVAEHTDVPVVLHVQGIVKPYYDVYLPFCSWPKYILCGGGGFSAALQRFYTRSRWRHAVRREARILDLVQNYLCRTDWDREMTLAANPKARILHGGEVLRPVFYEAEPWKVKPHEATPVFVTTISEPPYKGMDLVLKAGANLKEMGVEFVWKVYGNVNPRFFEKITGITCEQAGVTLCGVADAETLARELNACTAYVHPSYIDNSPNSVCEAQMLGVPVIAAAVGGVPSLIENGKTGFLFTPGSSASLATNMALLKIMPPEDLEALSVTTRSVALQRHERDAIVNELLATFASLCS